MKVIDLSDESIYNTWQMCSNIYKNNGIQLTYPSNTDLRKTYQWRYAKALTIKLIEWDFDEVTNESLIDIAVKHTKGSGLLRKGLSALLQNNVLDICLEQLKSNENFNDQSINSIAMVKKWFDSVIKDSDPTLKLLKRKNPNAFTNIVIWYQASKLSPLFLSLSKSCGKALNKLGRTDEYERKLLPSTTELYKIRTRFIANHNSKKQARLILGDEWRELCP